ncbi:MAG: ABC transporter ATP-binding protein [Paracoccaceae bacterium]|nr:ABC transporter ATP-binding protein [Paracoccaceae bacterium]MDG1736523.1 ABC transporter ATP-binding protein [Paracoccaceae bacterium]MDG2259007.1 ABC transporter ATP-binding protein [Paracoccaceae bacterium]
MDPIVTCRGVTKTFGSGELAVNALSRVDLDIAPGDFATLAGPSGSGKTTLLNMVGALDHPSAGEVTVDGQSLGDLKQAQLSDLRLRKIGFVFQSYNLVPVMSACENIEFVLELQGIAKADRRAKSLEALRDVGLVGLEHRRPAAMSGGQQQRVAVARALVSRPAIVLADEPSANLDSKSAGELIDLMLKLNDEHGTTFLIGTHDPRVLERSKRQINMLDGEIESDTRH